MVFLHAREIPVLQSVVSETFYPFIKHYNLWELSCTFQIDNCQRCDKNNIFRMTQGTLTLFIFFVCTNIFLCSSGRGRACAWPRPPMPRLSFDAVGEEGEDHRCVDCILQLHQHKLSILFF